MAAFLALVLPSCSAPDDFGAAVPWFVESEGVHDAGTRAVEDNPYLRFDDLERYRLGVLLHEDVARPGWRDDLDEVLSAAVARGVKVASFEIDRLPQPALDELAMRAQLRGERSDRAALREHFASLAASWLEERKAQMRALDDAALLAYAQDLNERIEDSIKEESSFLRILTHLPLAPVSLIAVDAIESGEYWGPSPVEKDFQQVALLKVAESPDPGTEGWDLLMRHAPVIIQQRVSDPPYDPSIDHLGRVVLHRDADGEVVPSVDTSDPTVYGHMEWAQLQGRLLPQLVYTLIYPEHPPLKSPDFEAGKIEVLILRVTLDAQDRPAIFESVYACGCHHRIRVAEHVARWAGPEDSGHHPMEIWLDGELVGAHVVEDVPDADPTAPICLYQYAGYHMSGTLRITHTPVLGEGRVVERESYHLRPYVELQHQRDGEAYLSLFDEDGLIISAGRSESFWLAGAGFFAAGHPRQRGTQ